jgi:2'-5' RNA ligase
VTNDRDSNPRDSNPRDPNTNPDAREKREPGKRLFVGIRVSVSTSNALSGAAETLARRARDAGVDIRWVAPVGYHVTLKFLGWTREPVISAVLDVLAKAAENTPRFTIKCARLGAFPTNEKASVVWAGIDEQSGALAELAKRIEQGCARLGFEPEKRAFHPHVTIGRLRKVAAIREVVLPMAEQMFGDTRVDSMTLFESETKSTGSVYKEVRRIDFKTAPEAPVSGSERQTLAVQLDATKRSTHAESETDDGWPRGHHHDDL